MKMEQTEKGELKRGRKGFVCLTSGTSQVFVLETGYLPQTVCSPDIIAPPEAVILPVTNPRVPWVCEIALITPEARLRHAGLPSQFGQIVEHDRRILSDLW